MDAVKRAFYAVLDIMSRPIAILAVGVVLLIAAAAEFYRHAAYKTGIIFPIILTLFSGAAIITALILRG